MRRLSIFKRKLTQTFQTNRIPSYYLTGQQCFSVFHARLRNYCSNLNSDLFNNHLIPSPICDCKKEIENAEHYLFKCTRYNTQRRQMFLNTRQFHPLSVQKLLFGNENISDLENETLFSEVQRFIKNSKRFEQPNQ